MVNSKSFFFLLILINFAALIGCEHKPDQERLPPDAPTSKISLQQTETGYFSTNLDDYEHSFEYTSNLAQTLTLKISILDGPGGGTNSAIATHISTSMGREIEVPDVMSRDTIWKDISLDRGEIITITLSTFGIFRDEYYQYEIALLPSYKKTLITDEITSEPNDTPNIATPSTLNTQYHHDLNYGHTDQCDVFKYHLTAGRNYTLSTTNFIGSGSSTTGGLQFKLSDEKLNPLLESYSLNQFQGKNSVFSPPSNGDYYFSSCSPSGTIYQNSFFKYEFAIWEPRSSWDDPFASQDYEPNDSAALAYEIDINENVESSLTLGPADFIDTYRLKTFPGYKYELTVTAVSGPNRSDLSRLKIRAIDSNGGQILIPETPLSIGASVTLPFNPNAETNAIIELYYTPSSGHEADIHQYKLLISHIH